MNKYISKINVKIVLQIEIILTVEWISSLTKFSKSSKSDEYFNMRQRIFQFVFHQSASYAIVLKIKDFDVLVSFETTDNSIDTLFAKLVALQVDLFNLTITQCFDQLNHSFVLESVLRQIKAPNETSTRLYALG